MTTLQSSNQSFKTKGQFWRYVEFGVFRKRGKPSKFKNAKLDRFKLFYSEK
jgi:hypothetical protein